MNKENRILTIDWIVFSKDTVIDSETNSLTIQNVIEEITIESPKQKEFTIPIQIKATALWRTNKISKKDLLIPAHLSFIDPHGKKLNEGVFKMKLEKGKKRMRSMINIDGIKITTPGTYTFEIGDGVEVLGRAFLEIIFK